MVSANRAVYAAYSELRRYSLHCWLSLPYITKDGELRRCIFDENTILETALKKPEPCGVQKCGNGLWLENLNPIETPSLYNFYASLVGAEPLPTDWMEPLAQSLGYGGSETTMTVESIRRYDALMAAYGKENLSNPKEFPITDRVPGEPTLLSRCETVLAGSSLAHH